MGNPNPSLSEGALLKICQGGTIKKPTLQVLMNKTITVSNSGRQVLLSDGRYSKLSMVALRMNHFITEGKLEAYTIVQVNNHACSNINGKKSIMLLDLEILKPGSEVGKQIGDPIQIAADGTVSCNQAPEVTNPGAQLRPAESELVSEYGQFLKRKEKRQKLDLGAHKNGGITITTGITASSSTPALSSDNAKKDVANRKTIVFPTQPLPKSALEEELSSTEHPKPPEVTANLLQTDRGPKIVLEGLKLSNFPKEDRSRIGKLAVEQLLRAQSEARQQNMVIPTKIVIDLPQSIQAQMKTMEKSAVSVMIMGDSEKPLPRPSNSAPAPAVSPTPPPILPPTAPVANPMITKRQEQKIALKNAPSTSEHPKPPRVTARFLHSDEGLRIVVHGLQGSNMTKADIARIQQQAKTKLLKTEVVIDLPASIRAKLQAAQTTDTALASTAAAQGNNSGADEQGVVAMVKPIINTHQAENLEIMYVSKIITLF